MSLHGRTVEELLHGWGQVDPDKEAFVSLHPATFHRRVLTRQQLLLLVRKFAASLRQKGVAKADVVCVALSNCLERVVVDLGIICSGAVALNGQVFRADGEDFIQALNSTKAKAVVLDPDSSRGAWVILKQHVGDIKGEEVSCALLPHLKRVIACRHSQDPALDFFTHLLSYNHSMQRVHALPQDVAVIWTTSGSTGYSKLVPQTHANLTHIALQVLHIAQLESGDKFLNCAPLGWAGGFPLWFLASGVTRVFVDTSGGPPADMALSLWEVVQRERCVYVFTTPMYVSTVLSRPALWQGENKWHPRCICLAGQPMKRELVLAAGQLCQYIDINYGTTECGVIATTRVHHADTFQDGQTGPAAVGVKMRVVNERLEDVVEGSMGQIVARSPALYGQYVNDKAATCKSFTNDGWFCTDDVGYLLPGGVLVHMGRRSDTITRGAYLCYPGWLEMLLRRAPGVQDLCIVPVPDPVVHQEICACVVPTQQPPPTDWESSLRTFADSLLLTQPGDAQHMLPKYYVILSVLPLTPTGKLSRKKAAALAVQRLGLSTE